MPLPACWHPAQSQSPRAGKTEIERCPWKCLPMVKNQFGLWHNKWCWASGMNQDYRRGWFAMSWDGAPFLHGQDAFVRKSSLEHHNIQYGACQNLPVWMTAMHADPFIQPSIFYIKLPVSRILQSEQLSGDRLKAFHWVYHGWNIRSVPCYYTSSSCIFCSHFFLCTKFSSFSHSNDLQHYYWAFNGKLMLNHQKSLWHLTRVWYVSSRQFDLTLIPTICIHSASFDCFHETALHSFTSSNWARKICSISVR